MVFEAEFSLHLELFFSSIILFIESPQSFFFKMCFNTHSFTWVLGPNACASSISPDDPFPWALNLRCVVIYYLE